MTCLYAESGGHSAKVGEATDGTPIYGKVRSFPRPAAHCVFIPVPPPYKRHMIHPFGRVLRLREGPRAVGEL
jgi:hypothetical protein